MSALAALSCFGWGNRSAFSEIETLAFPARLASGPALQQRLIKKLLYQSLRTDLRTSLEMVSSHMAVVQATAGYREAINAYKEKRPAKFEGR